MTGGMQASLKRDAYPADQYPRLVLLVFLAFVVAGNVGKGVLGVGTLSEKYADSTGVALGCVLLLMIGIAHSKGILRGGRRHQTGPSRRRRPITDDRVSAAIKDLAVSVGLESPHVELTADLSDYHVCAIAWKGTNALRVGGGLRRLVRNDRAAFDAIISHELGHIANRDIFVAHLSRSAAVATLAMTVIGGALIGVYYLWEWVSMLYQFKSSIAHEWNVGNVRANLVGLYLNVSYSLADVVFPSLVAMCEYAAILYAREADADAFAMSSGHTEALARVLQKNCAEARKSRSVLGRLWRLHPSALTRYTMVASGYEGLAARPVEWFAFGTAFSCMSHGLRNLIGELGANGIDVIGGSVIASGVAGSLSFVVFAVFLYALLGIGIRCQKEAARKIILWTSFDVREALVSIVVPSGWALLGSATADITWNLLSIEPNGAIGASLWAALTRGDDWETAAQIGMGVMCALVVSYALTYILIRYWHSVRPPRKLQWSIAIIGLLAFVFGAMVVVSVTADAERIEEFAVAFGVPAGFPIRLAMMVPAGFPLSVYTLILGLSIWGIGRRKFRSVLYQTRETSLAGWVTRRTGI